MAEFHAFITSCQLESCWGVCPDPLRPTTCNARTYLQPQLNKAIRRDESLSRADKNLKDWILFRAVTCSTWYLVLVTSHPLPRSAPLSSILHKRAIKPYQATQPP